MPKTKYLSAQQAELAGFARDRRRRRAQHRRAEKHLRTQGGGSILASVRWWHLEQARRP